MKSVVFRLTNFCSFCSDFGFVKYVDPSDNNAYKCKAAHPKIDNVGDLDSAIDDGDGDDTADNLTPYPCVNGKRNVSSGYASFPFLPVCLFSLSSGSGLSVPPLPVSSEISDFTPCANAQSNILHIKYAEKTYDYSSGFGVYLCRVRVRKRKILEV